jgi:low affinity Fe/Cu permease
MCRDIIARITGTLAAIAAFIVVTTSTAWAENDPGLGQGSGQPPPIAAPTAPFEVFGMAWQAALALGVALIAVIGLALTVQYRRHHPVGHHA